MTALDTIEPRELWHRRSARRALHGMKPSARARCERRMHEVIEPFGPKGTDRVRFLANAMGCRIDHLRFGGAIFLTLYRSWLDRAAGIRRHAARRAQKSAIIRELEAA